MVQVILLVHSLKEGNTELIAKGKLSQTRVSHVLKSYTSQLYQHAQESQDIKVPFLWREKTKLFRRI